MMRYMYLFIVAIVLASCNSDIKNPKAADLDGAWKMVHMKDPDITIEINKESVTPNTATKAAKDKAEMIAAKMNEYKSTAMVFKQGKLVTQVEGKDKDTRGFVLNEKNGKTYLAIEPGYQQANVYIKNGLLYMVDEVNRATIIWEKQ